ncbi:MAG: TlpA family protein disulfide reductase [Bacteroidia bacterium]|nr:TlpA family protein disulfide reductase [Bacteroidia bacterium]
MKLAMIIGLWRAVLLIPGDEIPFALDIVTEEKQYIVYIINADEKIRISEVEIVGDSMFLSLPVFNSEIRVKVGKGIMEGDFIDHSRSKNKRIPIKAALDVKERFPETSPKKADQNFNGRYKVVFSPNTDDEYLAIGIFEQEGSVVHGTFLTSTGDYRFLEGIADGDSLKLSCFDGAHAFLFKAKKEKGEIHGSFRSGVHWQEPWIATPNNNYELPDPFTLTYIKDGYSGLAFRFPDLDGDTVSLNDARFENKVTVVQILGSWCPNCMDESRFLSDFNKKNPDIEIVGLAFERSGDFSIAAKGLKRMCDQLEIQYPILVAGRASKRLAAEALPMLNQVLSFPTTIFVDKLGNVRKIHTGFLGPATGHYYDEFVQEFNSYIDQLRKE